MDRISLTYGRNPRHHIWIFVASPDEHLDYYRCPCIVGNSHHTAPSFVAGNDYFCETGVPDGQYWQRRYYTDDPLWDGQGCGPNSKRCQQSTMVL